jgi:uncharacterized protein YbjQ (UPF0145 family)
MLVTTTHNVEGKRILEYKGLVAGEAILGANLFRDLFASIRDIVGGRAGSYEKVLNDARKTAVSEMTDKAAQLGANAVIGVDIDYETVGTNGSMLMVTAAGTAVRIEYAGFSFPDSPGNQARQPVPRLARWTGQHPI